MKKWCKTHLSLLFISAMIVAFASTMAGRPALGAVDYFLGPAQTIVLPTSAPVTVPRVTAPVHIAASKRSVVYILAPTTDLTTATVLTLEVAMNVGPNVTHLAGLGPKDKENVPMIIPEPTWTLDDLTKQCKQNGATTRGAIVIGPVESDSGMWNALLFANSYNRLSAGASIVMCDPSAGSLQVAWASEKFVQGTANQGGISLLALGAAGTLLAARTFTTTAATTSTVTTLPTTSTQTTNNGAVSGFTTGATPGTSYTAPATNVQTTQNGATTSVTANSPQATGNSSTVINDAVPGLITNAAPFLSTTLPGAPASSLLKRASAKLAGDVTGQLTELCADGSTAKDVCRGLFAAGVGPPPAKDSVIPPIVLQYCAAEPLRRGDGKTVLNNSIISGVAASASPMEISFVNTTAKNISIVLLHVGSTDVADVGTFRPEQSVEWSIPAVPGACSLTAVRYEDGTEWSAPAPMPAAAPAPASAPAASASPAS